MKFHEPSNKSNCNELILLGKNLCIEFRLIFYNLFRNGLSIL